MKDVILLPTYNERENVNFIVPKIFNIVPDIHIIVVDDNSPDKTAQDVQELMHKFPNLSLLFRESKTGLGDAYKDGIRRVVFDPEVRNIITMDADGSHDPGYLTEILRYIEYSDFVVC